MSDYYNRNNRKRRKSRREKIGFYTAFSICLVAVGMAVYSTYNTLSNSDTAVTNPISVTEAEPVNNVATGVTVDLELPTLVSEFPSTVETEPPETEPSTQKPTGDALQTMLSTDLSLTFPLKTHTVLRPYSKESMYFKTLNVWKPHLGTDFTGELGDTVYAMAGGSVTKVKDDKMYGKTVEISLNDAVCIYSGLAGVTLKKGDSIEQGDKIGAIGSVPFEASDKNHIHVAVKVNGNYADPLTFLQNNE